MSDIQTCLAAFAVAAWSNNDKGRDMADRAIDQYLAKFRSADRRGALTALKVAYRNMQLDSQVAVEIVEHIDLRIERLPKRQWRRGSTDDESPLA